MKTFEVGGYAVCTEPGAFNLVRGQVYPVADIYKHSGRTWLDLGDDLGGYDAARFRPAEPVEDPRFTPYTPAEVGDPAAPVSGVIEVELRSGDRMTGPSEEFLWGELESGSIARYRVVSQGTPDSSSIDSLAEVVSEAVEEATGEPAWCPAEVFGLPTDGSVATRFRSLAKPGETRLVAFTGLKGSGKDTAASVFVERGYEHVKFADSLKEMLRTLLRYRGASETEIERMIEGDLKEEPTPYLSGRSPRYAMQTLGTEWGRGMMSDTFWIDAAEDRMAGRGRVVVSDVRFGNEAEVIRRRGGSLYRIQRGADTPAVADAHPSETEILTMPVDGVLFNTAASPEEFRERVIRPLAA